MKYSEQELRAFVGSKDDYFLTIWRPVLNGQMPITVPMFAPGVFHFFWLCYRGLITHAVLVAFLAGVLLSSTLFFFDYFDASARLAFLPKFVTIGIISLIVSMYGGRWYLNQAMQKITSVRSLLENEHDIQNELRSLGGPQWLSFLIGSPLCLAIAVGTTLGMTKVLNMMLVA